MGAGAPVGQSGIQLYNFRDYLSSGSGEILCPASPTPPTPYCTPTLPANNVNARMERLFAFLQAQGIKNVELYGYPGNPFPNNRQGILDLRALGDKYGLRFPARHGSLSESSWDAEIAASKLLGQEMVGEGGTDGAGGLGSARADAGDRAAARTSSASARSRPASAPRTSTTTTASSARGSPTTACSRARGKS